MNFPFHIPTRVTAILEAQEASEKVDGAVYVYARLEGGYIIDNLKREYDNEKIILTLLNGIPA